MFLEALPFLTCPAHPEQNLALESSLGEQSLADEIIRGSLFCPVCHARYPIVRGIPDLLGQSAFPNSAAQLINYLPLTAWAYERTWRPHALTLLSNESFGFARELPLITGMLDLDAAGLFIDIACSNGLYARAVAQARNGQAGHVIGIDHALPMLYQAREFALAAGLRITYVRASAQALPFRSAAASGTTMGGSLNEIGDTDQALRELRRVLAPQARCAMMCLVASEVPPGRLVQTLLGIGGIDFWSLERLNLAFQQAGLAVVEQNRYGVVVFSKLMAHDVTTNHGTGLVSARSQ
jgi:SAM-dependent methyltransferase